jgi:hypothetical protein
MTREFLRGWVEPIAPRTRAAVSAAETWAAPVVRAGFPVPLTDRIVALADRMPKLLQTFDRLPVSIAHNDSWRANLINARDRFVLIDWAWVGLSPLGVDVGMLTCASHFFLDADPDALQAFDDAVFDAYIEGLVAAGWDGDRRAVRFAYTTTAGLWGGITAPVWLPVWRVPERRVWLEKKFGCPLEQAAPRYAAALRFMLDLADEASSLAPALQ